MQQLPSRLLDNVVNEFNKLPGIGKKTALRLTLFMLNQSVEDAKMFTSAIDQMKNEVRICPQCHNIAENDLCEICSNPKRDASLICVVETIRELIAIENTGQYRGLYHVLGGRISPMDGIGPQNLNISTLEQRVAAGGIAEVILATSTTIEGDTTNFYLFRRLSAYNVPVSTLARGISVGDEIEYADEITLGRSLLNRVPYQGK
ncbi:MAG: recombination mediator RecR [Salinivirgaceae bacterium]|nr:recombination mediator RecR [Salinivirgaceae bacterium]